MHKPGHILVVDDDQVLRNYVGAHLQRQNYRVSGARDGQGALALIDGDRPDLVILDHMLPDMSGAQVLGILRNNQATRPIPVIVLSSDGSQARLRASMEQGADDFLSKPVQPRELFDAVAAQLRKHRPRGEAARGAAAPGQPVLYGYKILETLAGGGSGTAYLARHTATQAHCVIKTMALKPGAGSDAVARFLREGELLARLAHPNIVRERGCGISGDCAYLVTEYISGGSLKQMIGQAWTPLEAVRLLAGVARGLRAAHAAGIVHGDVKPDNIMLRASSLEPVLLDFGAARELGGNGLTPAGTVLGTPSYMAPEVIRGQDCGPPCDIYACGVIFYELLTGTKPYVADQPTELLRRHLQYPLPLLPSRLEAFQPLLARMLAKDPARRPADGAALGADLALLWKSMCN